MCRIYPHIKTKDKCWGFFLCFHLPTIAINMFLASFSPPTALISFLLSCFSSLLPFLSSPAIKSPLLPPLPSHIALSWCFFVCRLQHQYLISLSALGTWIFNTYVRQNDSNFSIIFRWMLFKSDGSGGCTHFHEKKMNLELYILYLKIKSIAALNPY